MGEFASLTEALGDFVVDIRKGIVLFSNRSVSSVFNSLRLSHGDSLHPDEIYLWFDLGEISFFLQKEKELVDLFLWISGELRFNVCVASLDIVKRGLVIPNDVLDDANKYIWGFQLFKNREIMFTCILKELPLSSQERKEFPHGGSWSLRFFLTERDERCAIHEGQWN